MLAHTCQLSVIRMVCVLSVRFSMIVGNSFLFMRGNRIEIYNSSKLKSIDNLSQADIQSALWNRCGRAFTTPMKA